MKSRTLFACLFLLSSLFYTVACADAKAGDSFVVLHNVNWGDSIGQVKSNVPWSYPNIDRGDVTFLSYSKINYTFEGLKARTAQLAFEEDHLILIQFIYSGESVYDELYNKQKELFGEETAFKEGKGYSLEKYEWELSDGTTVSLSPTPSSVSAGAYLTFENYSYKTEQAAKMADPENDKILFRNIPWGSSYQEVTSQISVNHWSKPDPDYATTVKNGMMDTGDIKYMDYVRCKTRGTPDMKVAGYPVDSILLWFVYTQDSNGHLTRDINDTAFYLAEYVIKPKDIDVVEKDLIEKLTSVYGDVDEEATGGYTIKEHRYLWYGSNKAVLVLTSQRYNSGSNYIRITYGWLEGDEYLQKAYDCIVAEEAENIGDGNTDGL